MICSFVQSICCACCLHFSAHSIIIAWVICVTHASIHTCSINGSWACYARSPYLLTRSTIFRTFLNPRTEICMYQFWWISGWTVQRSLNEDQRLSCRKWLIHAFFAWLHHEKVDVTCLGSMLNIIISELVLLLVIFQIVKGTSNCLATGFNPVAQSCFASLASDSLRLTSICVFFHLSLVCWALFGVYRPMDFRLEPHRWENWAYLTNLAIHYGGFYGWIEDFQTVNQKGT